MKKLMLVLVVVVLFAGGCSFNPLGIKGSGKIVSNSYDFENFTKIEAGNTFDVEIEQSEYFSIEVFCDDNIVKYLDIEKRGDTLVLGLENFQSYNYLDLKAIIKMPTIKKISGSGASDITIIDGFSLNNDLTLGLSGASSLSGDFEANNLEINISGASDMFGNLTIDDLNLDLSGSSSLTLKGTAHDLSASISGSSDAHLYDLTINNAKIDLSGASDAFISAYGEISVDASGSSTLFYKENNTVTIDNVDLSGSSSLKKVK